MNDRDPEQDRIDAFVEALVANDAMKETERYVTRGRAFALLPLDDLRERWVVAFRAWFASRSDSDAELVSDCGAELRLRGQELPFDAVEDELAKGREEIARLGPNAIDLKDKISDFLEELDREPH